MINIGDYFSPSWISSPAASLAKAWPWAWEMADGKGNSALSSASFPGKHVD